MDTCLAVDQQDFLTAIAVEPLKPDGLLPTQNRPRSAALCHPRKRSVTSGRSTASDQISVRSASSRASSTSTPRYRTVFPILVWPSRI